MPSLIPIIITLALSITAINLTLNGNIFGARDLSDHGKILGIAETADGRADALGSGVKDFNGAVSGTVNGVEKISQAAGMAGVIVQKTLPENKDAGAPVKMNEASQIELSCQRGIAIDLKSDKILFEKNAGEESSIASISKLMTALVFLDFNPGWDKIYKVKPEDMREGGLNHIFPGESVKVKDLFYTSLVASDNSATIAMIKSTGMSEADFVAEMNKKASLLDLKNTRFKDPLGLLDDNKSTALEVARFAQAALANEEIEKATLTRKYEFLTQEGKQKLILNTDNLLSAFPQDGVAIRGGKTGYTEAAGYCFVGEFMNNEGHDIISVILGSGDKEARFNITHNLIGWVFKSFKW